VNLNPEIVTVLGYPMSLFELIGTVASAYSVWLMGRLRITTWPVGIVGSALFAILFYQIRLYGDFIEQIYYVGANIYGWIVWSRPHARQNEITAFWSPPHVLALCAGGTLAASVIFGWFLSQFHILMPTLFQAPAELPYLDGFTTMGSFVAMVLMAQKRTESWIYWIVINIVSVGLYAVKDVFFIAILYGFYFVLALLGYRQWQEAGRKILHHEALP